MKKIVCFVPMILLGLTACLREQPEIPATKSAVRCVLTAGWEDATRVSLGEGLSCRWQEGDRIAVYDDVAIRAFDLCAADGASASFEGELEWHDGPFQAAYPYAAAKSCQSGAWTLTVPSGQQIAAGDSVAADALAAVARFTNLNELRFRHLTGLIRFTVSSDRIERVVLQGNDGEALSGVVVADASTAEISSVEEPQPSISLTHASGSFPPGSYYAAVLPGTLSAGLSMTLTSTSGQTASKSGTRAVTLARGGCVDLGDISSGLVWEEELRLDCGDTEDSDDNVALSSFDRRVRVNYGPSGATVSGAGGKVSVTVDGNRVTVDNTGKENVIYELSGAASDGCFKLYSSKKQAILLNGVDLKNPTGAAINNQGKKRTFVVIKGVNKLSDGPSYTGTPSGEDEKAALFSEGQLVFSGPGLLSVTSTGKGGISSDDYLRFMSAPTVRVNASAGHGLRGKEYVLISGGVLEVNVSADTKKGIVSDSLVCLTGGRTAVKVTGGTAYVAKDEEYTGTAGIKADKCFRMSGGELTITNSGVGGKGIRVGSNSDRQPLTLSEITGGKLTVKTTGGPHVEGDVSSKAVMVGWAVRSGPFTYESSSGDLTMSGGTVSIISEADEALEVKGKLTVEDGILYCRSDRDDAINTGGTLTVSGGKVCALGPNGDGMDSNGDLLISGGWVFSVGARMPEHSLDANYEAGYTLTVRGGTVVTAGAYHDGARVLQSCRHQLGWKPETWYSLSGNGFPNVAFKFPYSGVYSLAVCSDQGKPTLKSGVTVSGGTPLFEGRVLWDVSASGGKSVSWITGWPSY